MKILENLPHLNPAAVETAKSVTDHVAAGGVVLAMFQYLPGIAALMSICWYGYRFYEAFKAKREKRRLESLKSDDLDE